MTESEEFKDRFAQLIREKRTELGLSHEQLAVKAGLDRSTVSLYESGKRVPTLTSAMRIATALETKLSVMIARIEG